ncbi:putative GH25 family protein [Desulfitispora alkaliphila]|uniref:hypothetical protein n=1 Tax=Desulfitispora alkaliphila TaxID=622674 RepID=UPI003D1E6529
MFKFKKVIVTALILNLFFMLVVSNDAHAHRMIIRPVEEGLVRVVFDDDTVAVADIVITDLDGTEILTGQTDGDGYFKYDPNLEGMKMVADDGVGHRVQWVIGEPVQEHGSLWLRATGGVLFLAVIAGLFHMRNKK